MWSIDNMNPFDVYNFYSWHTYLLQLSWRRLHLYSICFYHFFLITTTSHEHKYRTFFISILHTWSDRTSTHSLVQFSQTTTSRNSSYLHISRYLISAIVRWCKLIILLLSTTRITVTLQMILTTTSHIFVNSHCLYSVHHFTSSFVPVFLHSCCFFFLLYDQILLFSSSLFSTSFASIHQFVSFPLREIFYDFFFTVSCIS